MNTISTILDIAKMAGVSKTLVSRALNNQPGVSEQSREKILRVSKELNYRPNMLAKSLVLQKTQTIGVVLDDLCVPFYFDMIRSLEANTKKHGFSSLFCGANDNEETKLKYIRFFTEGRCDGLVIYGSHINDARLIRNLAETKFPFILIENQIQDLAVNNVVLDNVYGSKLAVEHLISLGCKDIRHFMGDMNKSVSLDRLRGYVETMKQHGMEITDDSIINSHFSQQSGYTQMMKLIKDDNLPEAVFFAGDVTAFGAIRALAEAGIRIPEDIKLVGFDDDKPETFDRVFPALTTIKQPLYEMGQIAIDILVDSINHPNKEPVKKIICPELVIRTTCGSKIQI